MIELLVVTALLGMLAGLLYPVLAGARERGQRATCLSRLRQLAAAHHLYVADWDEQLPPWSLPGPPRPGNPDLTRYWTTYLQPYFRSRALLRDPAASGPEPSAPGPAALADYALLTWRQGGRRGDPSEPKMRWPGPPLSLGQVVRPAGTIQWMDGRTTTTGSLGITRRHGEGLTVTFVDGHARWMREKEFWQTERDSDGFYWLTYGAADR